MYIYLSYLNILIHLSIYLYIYLSIYIYLSYLNIFIYLSIYMYYIYLYLSIRSPPRCCMYMYDISRTNDTNSVYRAYSGLNLGCRFRNYAKSPRDACSLFNYTYYHSIPLCLLYYIMYLHASN